MVLHDRHAIAVTGVIAVEHAQPERARWVRRLLEPARARAVRPIDVRVPVKRGRAAVDGIPGDGPRRARLKVAARGVRVEPRVRNEARERGAEARLVDRPAAREDDTDVFSAAAQGKNDITRWTGA